MALVTRDELYECVWSKPMVQVAEQFGVSGSYMTRVCSALRVPRPGAGYWAKVAVGRAPPPKPLPQAQPGDQLYWSKGGDLDRVPAIKPEAPAATRSRKRIAGTHALVRDAKTHFESGRKVKEGQYLKPCKKLLLDVTASQAGLDKALDFANDIYNVLESAGHRVVLAPSQSS